MPEGNEFLVFQRTGNPEALLRHLRAKGRSEPKYRRAVEALAPFFEGLNMGERPSYESLYAAEILRRKAEVKNIVIWMVGSDMADVKTAALELAGFLRWDELIPLLTRSATSGPKWERITAIRALGRMGTKGRVALHSVEDDDPEIRMEIARLRRNLRS